MHRTKRGIALLLTLVAVAGLAACGSDDDETTDTTATSAQSTTGGNGSTANGKQPADNDQPSIETIVVRNGEPVGGSAELEYDAGEQVRFRVSSNEADEVHVHGYDIGEEVPAGGTATISFPADIEGIFEIELHGSEKQIAELRVNP